MRFTRRREPNNKRETLCWWTVRRMPSMTPTLTVQRVSNRNGLTAKTPRTPRKKRMVWWRGSELRGRQLAVRRVSNRNEITGRHEGGKIENKQRIFDWGLCVARRRGRQRSDRGCFDLELAPEISRRSLFAISVMRVRARALGFIVLGEMCFNWEQITSAQCCATVRFDVESEPNRNFPPSRLPVSPEIVRAVQCRRGRAAASFGEGCD